MKIILKNLKTVKIPILLDCIRWIPSDQMRESSPSESHLAESPLGTSQNASSDRFSATLLLNLMKIIFKLAILVAIGRCSADLLPPLAYCIIVSLRSSSLDFRLSSISQKCAHDSLEKLIKIQHLVGHRWPVSEIRSLTTSSVTRWKFWWSSVDLAVLTAKRLSKYDLELDE